MQANKKFYNKCAENSRSQIVFRTDIFRNWRGVPLTSVWRLPFAAHDIRLGVFGHKLEHHCFHLWLFFFVLNRTAYYLEFVTRITSAISFYATCKWTQQFSTFLAQQRWELLRSFARTLQLPLQHAAERDWQGLFQNILVHNNNNNNFIDFIFDMKISVPKQWQMKQSKIKVRQEQ